MTSLLLPIEVLGKCVVWAFSATCYPARLTTVAHVAQWIERLPPEQKVVGPIPTVGAKKVVDTLMVKNRSHPYVHGALIFARHVAKTLVSEQRDLHRALMIQSPFSSTLEEE